MTLQKRATQYYKKLRFVTRKISPKKNMYDSLHILCKRVLLAFNRF